MFYDNTKPSEMRTQMGGHDSVNAKFDEEWQAYRTLARQIGHDLPRVNGSGLIIALFQFLYVSVPSERSIQGRSDSLSQDVARLQSSLREKDEMSQKGVPVVFWYTPGTFWSHLKAWQHTCGYSLKHCLKYEQGNSVSGKGWAYHGTFRRDQVVFCNGLLSCLMFCFSWEPSSFLSPFHWVLCSLRHFPLLL